MELTITGLEEVQRRLKAAPKALAAKAYLKALDRAAGVIAAEVEARTPEGETGLLKESVITSVELDSEGRGGTAAVGFNSSVSERTGKPQDLIAFWVEYGHRQVSHGSKKSSRHEIGQVDAHPFLRPAADGAGDRAIEVFAEVLSENLSVIEEGSGE